MEMKPKGRQLRMKWSTEEQKDVLSDDFLGKILVDAGNLEEIIDSEQIFSWSPDLEVQIERLADEWSHPDSNGTGFLTYSKLSSIMAEEIRAEIDKQILDTISALAIPPELLNGSS